MTWQPPAPVEVPPALLEAVGEPLLAELLHRRGVATDILDDTYVGVDAPDLPDLAAGAARVVQAIATRELVLVYGDYDADGVTSTALLIGLLRSLGANARYHVPDRFAEGYGMHRRVVERAAADSVGLILTCDCGIRNHGEIELANGLGMQVVVTDHHELGATLPPALAIVNPKRLAHDHPCHWLPGVGVAYLLAREILRQLERDPAEADRWLDLVAVGIIADVVPITGANRNLGRAGLHRLGTSPCPGLGALLTIAALPPSLTEEDVGFQVSPRLNSAGRLASATLSVELLLAPDLASARDFAVRIDELNVNRRRFVAALLEEALAEVGAMGGPGDGIVLYRAHWHEGVLGIAAGQLASRFHCPVLLLSRKHDGQTLVGSARAPADFALHESLNACGEHLLKFGGHAAAAGCSLLEERFPGFRAAFLEELRRRRPAGPPPAQTADLRLHADQIDRRLYEVLRRAGPFGEGFPAPVLYVEDAQLLSARPLGRESRHQRLVVRGESSTFAGVWWNAPSEAIPLGPVHLYGTVGLSRWHGEESLQLTVLDLSEWQADALAAPALSPRRQVTLWDRRRELPAVGTAARRVTPAAGPAMVPPAAPAAAPPLPAAAEASGDYGPPPVDLVFAEGPRPLAGSVDRYKLQPARHLLLSSPPAGRRLLQEILAVTAAEHVTLAYDAAEPPPDRFLASLMPLLADRLRIAPYVDVSDLAPATGELEATVEAGLYALAASNLIRLEPMEPGRYRVTPRGGQSGVKPSPALDQLRELLAESRAFRRHLRSGTVAVLRPLLTPP